ncbi:MAG: hypothetical protein AcusKO_08100 [Acuticoccus sp.]
MGGDEAGIDRVGIGEVACMGDEAAHRVRLRQRRRRWRGAIAAATAGPSKAGQRARDMLVGPDQIEDAPGAILAEIARSSSAARLPREKRSHSNRQRGQPGDVASRHLGPHRKEREGAAEPVGQEGVATGASGQGAPGRVRAGPPTSASSPFSGEPS